MQRLSFSSTDSERERRSRRKRLWTGLGVGLVLVVILIALLAVFVGRHREPPKPATSTPTTLNPNLTSTVASTFEPNLTSTVASTFEPNLTSTATPQSRCPALTDDSQRIDCHPDRPVTEEGCLKRNCCYEPASDLNVTDVHLINSRYLGVPSCYFPENYKGYELKGDVKQDGNSIDAYLERGDTPSGFSKDVKTLRLEVTPIDDNRLRIKITDANITRFQPEVYINYETKKDRKDLYSVNLTSDGVLQVLRIGTNNVVFRSDLSRLIFSDQFLQLTTDVSSKYIYGLGEQKETILKSTNWARYTLFNQGDLPVPNRNLYGSHPFYLVMEPNGFSSGVFLLNSNAIDYVLQPKPAITIRPVGGIFDFYLFLGPTPGDVVNQYTSLFTAPNFPPRWSLGFHICKYGYFTLNATSKVLKRNLEAGVRVDVQWHDIDYMQRHLDFTYDPKNFSGLPEFVTDLHKNGRHYVAMISPGVSNIEPLGTYPPFDMGKKLDLFVKDTSGKYIQGKVWNENYTVFPDFSNPSTANYWKQHFEEFHKKLDFDGVWIDMNEPLNFLNGSDEGCPNTEYDNLQYLPGRPYPLNTLTLCMSANHNKTKHYNEHNLVGYREAIATHNAMRSITGKRPFIISRATFAGQGVYSGHWSGDITSDWDDMRYTIPAMLAFSLYGMPMTGSDICGFRLNTSTELCTRWQSLGAFYPFSRNHNDFDTIEQDPAAMGGTVLEATKKALEIRYYLLPYLYTLFYRNHIAGETVARPLFFEFPNDENTYDKEETFLLGPALLIIPVLKEGASSVTAYLPNGTWHDLNGMSYVSKGENIELDTNLTDINVLLRGGHILPAQKPGNTTVDSALNPFDLLVALNEDEKASGELFWDDGETVDTYRNGQYNLINMTVTQNTLNVSPSIKGFVAKMDLNYIKIFGLKSRPSTVHINGKEAKYDFPKGILVVTATGQSLIEDFSVKW